MCVCVRGPVGPREGQRRPPISPCRGGDSPEWSPPNQRCSRSTSGGKVYCQLCFCSRPQKILRQSALKGTDLRRRLQPEDLQRKGSARSRARGARRRYHERRALNAPLCDGFVPPTTTITTKIPTVISWCCFSPSCFDTFLFFCCLCPFSPLSYLC